MFKKLKPSNRTSLSRETIKIRVQNEFNGNISKASKALNIKRRLLSYIVNGELDKYDKVSRYIVTYAQNNTHVHEGFYKSIQMYMALNKNTELICYRGFYDPKKDSEKIKPEDVWYDPKIVPYLMNTNRELNSNVTIYPAHTRPTAVRPLSGYETHTGHMSGIFPHPKIQLETIPTPGNKLPKILSTTGAITLRNYSVSKAGEKGKHHHAFGAVIVEIENDKVFHLRHINAQQDGSFYDIAGNTVNFYTPEGVHTKQNIESLFCGDTHLHFVNWDVIEAQRKLIKMSKPSSIFLNDVLDFWRENHHEKNNRFLRHAKNTEGEICVKEEVKAAAEFIEEQRNISGADVYIVRSNHDEALERWLNEATPENVGVNAPYWHWLSYHKHNSKRKVPNGFWFHNSFEFACDEFLKNKKNIHFLEQDESCIIQGIENGYHGHYGPNGARGTVKGFSKIGVKTNTAHGHCPQIIDGAYRAGINCLRLGYVKGPSGQLETDIMTYPNGKRTLINYINGKYCI